jgi:caspase domain-containing protein
MSIPLNFNQPNLYLRFAKILAVSLFLGLSVPHAQARKQNDQRGVGARPADQVNTLPEKSKRYALIIGVDKYADSSVSPLDGASNDAKALTDALIRYASFPADQVILLASDQPPQRQPTREEILLRLSNLRSAAPKDGLLLVAFAGHGVERNGQAYLLPSNARIQGDIELLQETSISVTRMKDAISAVGVGQVVLFLDACRNDPASGRSDSVNPLTNAYTRSFNFDVRNREVTAFATLYATEVGKRAYEYKEKRQGYFTWALVEGLQGAAANERGEVTLSRLIRHVQEAVPKRVRLDLGQSVSQKPFAVVEGYRADELVIAVTKRRAPGNSPEAEIAYWNSIKDSVNPANFQAYLADYPQGRFHRLAENRLSELGGPENPKRLFETIHNLIYVKKDTRSAAALFASLIPNEERVRKALREDVPPETLQKILDMYKQFELPTEANVNRLARPEQKIVKAHGATTEEIARGFPEFPGGTVEVAKQILRPGMTFYEVEFLEPGKELGKKFHLLYWDGNQWTILGAVWRALE